MIPYREQVEFINTLTLSSGQRKTITCPFCNGRNKFTVTQLNGKILWNCFKASCSARGGVSIGYSLEDIKNKTFTSPTIKNSREVPSVLSHPNNHPKVVTYLKQTNCYYAFINNLVNVKYDPVEDRVLFLSSDESFAVGRSLSKRLPKWLTYGNKNKLFIIGKSDIAVLVEDVPSAAVVAEMGLCGIALCGTSLNQSQMSQLLNFKRVIVALDKDASKSSIKLSKAITHPNVTVRLLQKDIKEMDDLDLDSFCKTLLRGREEENVYETR